MKAHFISVIICIFIYLFCFTDKTNAAIKTSVIDTACCAPDSLKVVSTDFPFFCVSWHVPADSNCRTPIGFEIQWRYYPSSNPWTSSTVLYTGGTTINICHSVDTCRNYQWRVRTICDTANGGVYSDWVYGNKFGMKNCGNGFQKPDALFNEPDNEAIKRSFSTPALKPNED